MLYRTLLETLTFELNEFKKGRLSLSRLIADIEAITSNHPYEVGAKELTELVGELEIINAIILDKKSNKNFEDFKSDVDELVHHIEQLVDGIAKN